MLSAYQPQWNEETARGEDRLKALPLQAPMPMPVPALGRIVHFDAEERVEHLEEQQAEQQQQTPWRLTLPPAEVPRSGLGLAGMRDGEWI